MIRLAFFIIGVFASGPAVAGHTADELCLQKSGHEAAIYTECVHFLDGYQAAKGWRCDTTAWAEYLEKDVPQDMRRALGPVVTIIEVTAAAFCDKGIPEN